MHLRSTKVRTLVNNSNGQKSTSEPLFMMSSKWKTLKMEKKDAGIALTRQYFSGMLPRLPHRTGSTIHALPSQNFASFRETITSQARNGTFENCLLCLLELMQQVVDETGWTIQHSNGSTDIKSLTVTCTSDIYNPDLTAESLLILCSLCEHGCSASIAAKAQLDVNWEDYNTNTDPPSMEGVVQRVIKEKGKLEKSVQLDTAGSVIRILSRVCPPHVLSCAPSVTPYYSERKTHLVDSLQRVLWNSCYRLLAAVILVHYTNSFHGFEEMVFERTFNHPTEELHFDINYRPEVLGLFYFAPNDLGVKFEKMPHYFQRTKSPAQVDLLSIIFHRTINVYTSIAFKTSEQKFDRMKHLQRVTADMIAFSKLRTSSINSSDHSLHSLITKLVLVSSFDGKWWTRSHKQTPPYWFRYLNFYRRCLTSPRPEDFLAGMCYLCQLVYFVYLEVSAAVDPEQSEALQRIVNGIYDEVSQGVQRMLHERPLTNSTAATAMQFHVSYSLLNESKYFEDNFTDSTLNGIRLYTTLAALSQPVHIRDSAHLDKLNKRSSRILHSVCVAANRSLEPGANSDYYSEAFLIGLLHIRSSPNTAIYLSEESLLEFAGTVIKCLPQMSPRHRDYAIGAFIHLIIYSKQGSVDSMVRIYHMLCGLLNGCEKVLQGTLNWNLELVYDILEARLHVTRRLLEADPSKFKADPQLEYAVRAALVTLFCSGDFATSSNALKCIQILCQEIETWLEGKVPYDEFMKLSIFEQSCGKMFQGLNEATIGHSFFIQNITYKLHVQFPRPPVAASTLKLTQASIIAWKKLCEDVDGTRISASMKKANINLMIFIGWLARAMAISHVKEIRDINTERLKLLFENLVSTSVHVREANAVVLRSCLIADSEMAIFMLQAGYNYALKPLIERHKNGTVSDVDFMRCMSTACGLFMRYITAAGEGVTPPQFDCGIIAKVAFSECHNFFDSSSDSLVKPFFDLLAATANPDNSRLLLASKFDTFSEIVGVLCGHLERDEARYTKLGSRALLYLFDDYTIYTNPAGSYSVFDSRYSSFKKLTALLQSMYYLLEKSDDHERAAEVKNTIVNLCLANQEMSVVLFEETMGPKQGLLRSCLYESFTVTFGEENDDMVSSKYDELVSFMLRDYVVIEGMCELCPYSEHRDFVTYVSTFFAEYGKSYELAKWGFLRDLESADSAEDLLRKNTLNVQLLLQVLIVSWKHTLEPTVKELIKDVYARPFSYLALGDDSKPEAQECSDFINEAMQKLQKNVDTSPASLGSFLNLITAQVEVKFPGKSPLVFKNLLSLRVICPMIVSPQNFGLVAHLPEGVIRDALVKLAKYLQAVNVEKYDSKCAKNFRDLMNRLREASNNPVSVWVAGEQFSSEAIDLAYYNIHQFLCRHSRELNSYFYTNSRESHHSSFVDGFLSPTNFDSRSVESKDSHTSHHSSTLSSIAPNGYFGTNQSNDLCEEFSRLIVKLGRPCTGFYNDKSERQLSNRGRKGSVALWMSADSRLVYAAPYKDDVYFVVSYCARQLLESYLERNELASYLTETCHSVQKAHPGVELCIFGDNTWQCIDPKHLMDMREPFLKQIPRLGLKFKVTSHFNVSFVLFQRKFELLHAAVDSFSKKVQYITSADVTPEFVTAIELTAETQLVVHDIVGATKHENVSLQWEGTFYTFTVYVGKNFIQVISAMGSCDVFSFESIRFVNGCMHLKKKAGIEIEFTLNLGESEALHKQLWEVFNISRYNSKSFLPQPLLELSVARFHTFLICMCVRDLLYPKGCMRKSAYNLLPSLLKRFNLKGLDVCPILQPTYRQTNRVTQLVDTLASRNPKYAVDVILSFTSIYSREHYVHPDDICLIAPWFRALPEAFKHPKNVKRLDLLVRSVVSLLEILDKSSPESRVVVQECAWEHLMHEDIAAQVIDVYISSSVFRIQALKETHCIDFPWALTPSLFKHTYKLIFDTLGSGVEHCDPDHLSWSEHKKWPHVCVAIKILCHSVFTDLDEFMEVLPEVIVILFSFCTAGPYLLRKALHGFMNTLLDMFASKPGLQSGAIKELRKLQHEVNSDRGMLIFGISECTDDEIFDNFDNPPAGDLFTIDTYLFDACALVMSINDLHSLRKDIATKYHQLLKIGFIPFRRRVHFGMICFTNQKLSSNGVMLHSTTFVSVLETCKHESHFISSLHSFELHCDRMLVWLEDEHLIRYLWVGVALSTISYAPVLSQAVGIINACLRHLQISGSKSSVPMSKRLLDSCSDSYREWWAACPRTSSVIPLPTERSCLTAVLSLSLGSSMCDLALRPSALKACENWILAFQGDPEIPSLLEFSLPLFIFSPRDKVAESIELYGVLPGFEGRKDLEERIIAKFAQDISDNPVNGLSAIINVCQVLNSYFSVPVIKRFCDIVCRITHEELLGSIEPFIWRICVKVLPLFENENGDVTMKWAESVATMRNISDDSIDTKLAFVKKTLQKAGRYFTVTDEFELKRPIVTRDFSKETCACVSGAFRAIQPRRPNQSIQ